MKKFLQVFSASLLFPLAGIAEEQALAPMWLYGIPIVINVDGEKFASDSACIGFFSCIQNNTFKKLGSFSSSVNNKSDNEQKIPELPKNISYGKPDEKLFKCVDLFFELFPNISRMMETARADPERIVDFISSENDAKRALKFLEMTDLENSTLRFAVFTNPLKEAAVFFKSSNPKARASMNFAVFEFHDGLPRWNLSTKSLTISLLSEAAQMDTLTFKECVNLGLNAKFIPLTNGQNSNDPAFVFYQTAQKEFYAMRLAEYAEFMTDKSKEVYTKQFLSMTKEEQQKTLEDYIQWHKTFYGVYDTGKVKVIVFKRTRECATHEMYDCAFIIETEDGLKLCNFGQNQGAFADYAVEQAKAAGF